MEKFEHPSDLKKEQKIIGHKKIEVRMVRENYGPDREPHPYYSEFGFLTKKNGSHFYNDGVANAEYLDNGEAKIEEIPVKDLESEVPKYFILGWSNTAGGAFNHSVRFDSQKTVEYDPNNFWVRIESGVTDNSGALTAKSYSEMMAIMKHTGWKTAITEDGKYIEGWTDAPITEETKKEHIFLGDM